MEVRGARQDVQLLLRGHARVVLLLRRGGDRADTEPHRLLVRLLRERSGERVAARMRHRGKVQWEEGKGLTRPARREHDVVVRAEPHQFEDVRLCARVHLFIGGRAVTDL